MFEKAVLDGKIGVGTQIASESESEESSSSSESDSKSSDEEKTKKSKLVPIKGKKVGIRDLKRANIDINYERPSSATSNVSVTSTKTVVARPVKNGEAVPDGHQGMGLFDVVPGDNKAKMKRPAPR